MINTVPQYCYSPRNNKPGKKVCFCRRRIKWFEKNGEQNYRFCPFPALCLIFTFFYILLFCFWRILEINFQGFTSAHIVCVYAGDAAVGNTLAYAKEVFQDQDSQDFRICRIFRSASWKSVNPVNPDSDELKQQPPALVIAVDTGLWLRQCAVWADSTGRSQRPYTVCSH